MCGSKVLGLERVGIHRQHLRAGRNSLLSSRSRPEPTGGGPAHAQRDLSASDDAELSKVLAATGGEVKPPGSGEYSRFP